MINSSGTPPLSAGKIPVDIGSTGTVALTGTVTLGAGAAVVGHVVADTGSTTAVTGNVTVVQATGTNLHAVIDSGTVTANAGTNLNTSALALDSTVAKDASLTTIDTDLKAAQPRKIQDSSGGSIILGQKAMTSSLPVVLASDQAAIPATQSGTWTVQPGNTANTTAWKVDGSAVTQPVSGSVTVLVTKNTRADTYTTTASGVTIDASANPFSTYAIQVKGTGGVASVWDVRLEGSLDNVNFSQILQHTNSTGDGAVLWSGAVLAPSLYFRSRCAGLTLALATNIVVTILGVQ